MYTSHHECFQFFTTPGELRKIADEMEQIWPTLRAGADKTVFTFWSNDAEFRILIDQERIGDEAAGVRSTK